MRRYVPVKQGTSKLVLIDAMRRIVNKNDDRTLFLVEFPVHQVFAETGKLKDVIGITPEVTPEVDFRTSFDCHWGKGAGRA